MTQLSNYITTRDAAQQIGLTERRVRQLLAAGVLAGIKITPQTWLVDRRTVAAYLRERRPVKR